MAPFHQSQLSEKPGQGGRKLTWIDKRAIENRLDEVCGPNGWKPEYESTSRGYKCRLSILCPAFDGQWVWHAKEDGAGFEEMGAENKKTGEFEYDVDNDEKSGYTNALRRAAQDAWGIGRYLYQKGIPNFLDPNAVAPAELQARDKAKKDAYDAQREQAAPAASQPAQQSQPQGQGQQTRQYDNFKIPRVGKQVFAWAKEMEKVFEVTLIQTMGNRGNDRGVGSKFGDWDQDTVDAICLDVIAFIKTCPTYKGQFDAINTNTQDAPSRAPIGTTGTNIADLRRDLMGEITDLLLKQLPGPATTQQLKDTFAKIAANSKNCDGKLGTVVQSLAQCTDVVHIRNMIAFTAQQIKDHEAAGTEPDQGDSEIPF